MFFTFFFIAVAHLQPIFSQELQVIPKQDILQILSSNKIFCECKRHKYLVPSNNLGCKCQFFHGQNNLILPNPCACRKSENIVAYNLGYGCQGQNNLMPQSIVPSGCRCQTQNNLLPLNSIGYGCQPQNTLIPPNNNCGCKGQQNVLLPINNVWYETKQPNNLIPVYDIGHTCKLQNAIPSNNIESGYQEQQNIIPQTPGNIRYGFDRPNNLIPPYNEREINIVPVQKTLNANQIPCLPNENELSFTNFFPDLPATILPHEFPERISRETADILPRNDYLLDLKSRLAEMTDLVSATANLLSILPKHFNINTFPSNKTENMPITDMPVTGNDESLPVNT